VTLECCVCTCTYAYDGSVVVRFGCARAWFDGLSCDLRLYFWGFLNAIWWIGADPCLIRLWVWLCGYRITCLGGIFNSNLMDRCGSLLNSSASVAVWIAVALVGDWGRHHSIGTAIQGLGWLSSNPPWGWINVADSLLTTFFFGGDLINGMDVPCSLFEIWFLNTCIMLLPVLFTCELCRT
jgi:hypothetical protein